MYVVLDGCHIEVVAHYLVTFLDNALDAWMRARFDSSTGLLVTGSIWLLVGAYMVRFLAAALGAYEGGQSMVHGNITMCADQRRQDELAESVSSDGTC